VERASGDLDAALADFNKAVELKPDNATAYDDRGIVKRAKGDLDGALADYNKCIELKPDDTYAYNNRGLLRKARGDLDGALADYNKSIELNPKFAGAYHSRGCLRYDAQKFPDALIDFRTEDELDASLDYGHFRVWLIRARLGEKEAATKELQAYLDNRKTGKPDDWAAQIARFLAGELAEPEFLKAAENADRTKEAGQLCEAWFYAGTKYLIDGDKAKAAEYFDKCVATGESGFYEYRSAAAELKAMKAGK
jgi:lipoprotein NlpI